MHRYILCWPNGLGSVKSEKKKWSTVSANTEKPNLAGSALSWFLDLISIMFVSKYGKRPMHLFGWLGTLFFLIGFGIVGYLIIIKIVDPANSLTNRPPFYISLATMIIGAQLFVQDFSVN